MSIGNIAKLSSIKIGIIGCGHLGRTLARTLLDNHLPVENLIISYGGSSSTLASIKKEGLIENVRDNDELCRESNIIFITVKPQDFLKLKKLQFTKGAIVVSCMAGISISTLKNVLDGAGTHAFHRIMPSGPDTIKEGKGIVAVYPHHDHLINILINMGLKVFQLPSEEMMHTFTVGVCLPAAILAARQKKFGDRFGDEDSRHRIPRF